MNVIELMVYERKASSVEKCGSGKVVDDSGNCNVDCHAQFHCLFDVNWKIGGCAYVT